MGVKQERHANLLTPAVRRRRHLFSPGRLVTADFCFSDLLAWYLGGNRKRQSCLKTKGSESPKQSLRLLSCPLEEMWIPDGCLRH